MQTICVTKYLLQKLGNLIQSSATFRFILCLYHMLLRFCIFLKKEYHASRLYAFVERAAARLVSDYRVSLFKKYVFGKERIQHAYEDSFLCRLICKIFSILSNISGKVFSKLAAASKDGIVYGAASFIKSKSFFSYSNILALYIVCMIICPHEIWNNLYAVVAAVMLMFFFLARTYLKLETPDIKSEGFGLVVFVIFVGVSGVYASQSADALRIILFLYSAIAFGFLIRQSVNTRDKLISVLKIIATGAFVTSVIGIMQRIQGVEVNPEYVDVLANASMPGRVFSTFANPNNFAELLVLTMPFTASLIFVSKDNREKSIWVVFLTVDFIALGMSYSRSSWVALAIATVIFITVYDWRLLVPCIFVCIVIFPFLPQSITDRVLTIGSMKDTSNASRLYIWSGAWKMVKEYFVSGVGAGPLTFKDYYFPLANPLMSTAPHSHMLYMELVIEFGIFAFVGFISYLFVTCKKAFSLFSHISKDNKAIIGALVASMFGMGFVFAVEYVWFYPRDMFMFWIVLGLLSAACKVLGTKQNER